MTIRAVFFDVGETLVDETRQWGAWADWLGIPRLTCFAVLGAVGRGEAIANILRAGRRDGGVSAARDRLCRRPPRQRRDSSRRIRDGRGVPTTRAVGLFARRPP